MSSDSQSIEELMSYLKGLNIPTIYIRSYFINAAFFEHDYESRSLDLPESLIERSVFNNMQRALKAKLEESRTIISQFKTYQKDTLTKEQRNQFMQAILNLGDANYELYKLNQQTPIDSKDFFEKLNKLASLLENNGQSTVQDNQPTHEEA